MDQAKDNEKGEHRMDVFRGFTSPYYSYEEAVVVALILASISAWHAP